MQNHASRYVKMYIGAGLLVLTSVGSILAGNILGSGKANTVEFGAGQYYLESCNSWLSLNLISGATGSFGAPAGMSPLIGVELFGLNSSKSVSYTHLRAHET